MSKRYSMAHAREELAHVLDLAERGESVVIERRGVQFTVSVARDAPRRRRAAHLEIVDPAIEAGQWSWEWKDGGLDFVDARPRKKRK